MLQADGATQKQLDLVRMTENSKRTLEQEVSAYRWEQCIHTPWWLLSVFPFSVLHVALAAIAAVRL